MPSITSSPTNIVYSTAAGTGTLQGAINLAQSTGLPLFIAPGIYTEASVIIGGTVTIYARKDSVQLRSSTSNAFVMQIGSGTTSSRIPGVVIRGLNFDGENKPLGGQNGLLQFFNADRMVVEDCFFWRSTSSGLYLYGAEGRVSGNRCDNCSASLSSVNGAGLTIENNYLTNSLNTGIECYRSPWAVSQTYFDGTIIQRNRVYTVLNNSGGSGQWGNAIACNGLRFLRIADNFISNANYSAIRVNYCKDVTISSNQVDAAREVAIFVENPADYAGGWTNVVISGNTLNNVGGGIVCVNNNAGSRRATITGNAIYYVKKNTFTEYTDGVSGGYSRITHGVGIWLAADCIADGNTIEYAEAAGIAAIFSGTWNGQGAPDQNTVTALISNNILKYCYVGVGYSDNDPRTFAEISGNIIVGAGAFQIVKMAVTSLPSPAPEGNYYGPPAPVAGAPEMGSVSNAVSTRWSFNRNKIVSATV
ncbi:TIGR03808 family TAT-translocated repetitive protein [Methylocystis sp. JR02]|uniref:TIGR03808 family TAT-translocated repetitive protein n=1 Tax=Methylocystis sp. JR02 TaxID=3046284 RepID=UPI0024BB50ED|nr:TIGR03808 family TAT-translocated repetitive protein [Methylocystis sp. JR02]MDJ0449398.1 TIGR03808 family TAT-translocated repetitive protein [Methylocystis sp. JR02]